jgi:hypothetical protein
LALQGFEFCSNNHLLFPSVFELCILMHAQQSIHKVI